MYTYIHSNIVTCWYHLLFIFLQDAYFGTVNLGHSQTEVGVCDEVVFLLVLAISHDMNKVSKRNEFRASTCPETPKALKTMYVHMPVLLL